MRNLGYILTDHHDDGRLLTRRYDTLAEAERAAEEAARKQWQETPLIDFDGHAPPFPDDWRDAVSDLAAYYDDRGDGALTIKPLR